MNVKLAQSRDNPVHSRTQNYRNLMPGYQKGKMAEKAQKNSEKRQRIVLKRLIKRRKHYLSLARESFKNGRLKIFSKYGRFSAKMGGLESPEFILRTVLVIRFHKLYQQYSERLSLWSRETKGHQHSLPS